MSNKNLTTITILDKDYQIACPPGERDALHDAAAELDERMRAIRNTGSIIGLERIAVMAALNLCYENQVAQNTVSSGKLSPELESTLARLSEKIETATTS